MKKKIKNCDHHRKILLILCLSPVIVMLIVCVMVYTLTRKDVRDKYHLSESDMRSNLVVFDTALLLNSNTEKDYHDMVKTVEKTPEEFENMARLKEWNYRLMQKQSFLYARLDNQNLYCGNLQYLKVLSRRLPPFSGTSNISDATILRGDQYYLQYKKISFVRPDGKQCDLYIVTNLNVVLPHMRYLTTGFFVINAIVVILFAFIAVCYVCHSMIRPIALLQAAVQSIGNGELDFDLSGLKKNKGFADLSDDFEEMGTRIREAAEEQEKADILTREVIGNISHDLKTPLTAIKGYAEGILDGVASTPDRMERYVKTIHTKATDMALLVDELAFFTSINQNSIPYNYSKVYANHYFADCISELSLDLEMKHINLIFSTEVDDRARIRVDLEKMKRVVNNIIGNAGKYIHNKEGIIVVSLSQENDEIIVRMQDNGQGIAEDELPCIFDRFYRTDSSRNSKTGGSGLGLAITKKIIEDHNGRIWAESKLGQGTAILFALKKLDELEDEEVTYE